MHSLTDTGTCNIMDDRKTKIKFFACHIFTVTQSHTGTSGSNVMVQIEVNKKINVSCIEFPKKISF